MLMTVDLVEPTGVEPANVRGRNPAVFTDIHYGPSSCVWSRRGSNPQLSGIFVPLCLPMSTTAPGVCDGERGETSSSKPSPRKSSSVIGAPRDLFRGTA